MQAGLELVRVHAREIKFLAARRIGELVPAEEPKKAGEKGGRGKKGAEDRQPLSISHQRLSEFRKLAEIPLDISNMRRIITLSKLLAEGHRHDRNRI